MLEMSRRRGVTGESLLLMRRGRGKRVHRRCAWAIVVALDTAALLWQGIGKARIHAPSCLVRYTISTWVVCVVQTLFKHAIVISHDSSKLGMQVEQGVVLAHRLTVCPRKFGSKGADALVKLLNLGLAQNGSRRLMLEDGRLGWQRD